MLIIIIVVLERLFIIILVLKLESKYYTLSSNTNPGFRNIVFIF